MKRIPVALLTVLLTGFVLAQSKEFWQTRDYRQWTEKECRKLLDNSPWAQDHTINSTYIEPLQTQSSDRARERNTQMTYHVQFRSALPVRQALVRLQQLSSKYDQMPPEQKQEFDQRAARLLEANFADIVAVHVSYSSNVAIYDREMANYWQVQTTEKLRNSTFLIGPKGQKIPPQRVTVTTGAGREFTLYFPRLVEGQPLVTPQDKSIKLEFNHPRVSDQNESRVLLEFKIEKMLMQGAVVY
ncbi:MAG: hypothetical protein U0Z53_06050 [Blastocatellia bacterium]